MADIIGVQYGMQLTLWILLQYPQVVEFVVGVFQQVLADLVELILDVAATQFEVLAEGIELGAQQQLFEIQAQAFFAFLVLTATVGEDATQLGLAAVIVEADEFVGLQPGAQFDKELIAVGEFDQGHAVAAFVDAASFAMLGVVEI